MAIHLSGWYHGIIGLEGKIIDIENLEIRPRIKDQEIEEYYDECIDQIGRIQEYFADEDSFGAARSQVNDENRAKLVAKNPRYPGLFNFKHNLNVKKELFLAIPSKDTKYFYVPHCLTNIPYSKDSP